jgi:hypothetical protein
MKSRVFGTDKQQEKLIGKDEGIQGISCPVPPACKIKTCWIKKLLVVQRDVKVWKMVYIKSPRIL